MGRRDRHARYIACVDTAVTAAGAQPLSDIHIPYVSGRQSSYSEAEDRFLLVAAQQAGYGNWELVKQLVTRAPQFMFDWWLLSRTPAELGRRVEVLARLFDTGGAKPAPLLGSKRKRGSKEDEESSGSDGEWDSDEVAPKKRK